ncbi:DUF2510 domain-containing protein [Actinospica durhamensis]|uniref:DUF2510 domain-containing protein n=1 Tax=Actinospica durhamensis TaxID=1508375 RepID=A0A941EQD7_9ACTN|nr:DUF2510 domain-containing protein [Actinospica durhamensis]MBR7835456.1 DUF2510 domain-containing protein [Actinospica durhamensis]
MSIPHDSPQPAAPPGWYPTGETGPDGAPVERWWDGSVWSAMVRPLGGGTFGPPRRGRSPRAKALIAAATVVVLAGAGTGLYFGLHNSNSSTPTAQSTPQATTGNGGSGLGGLGGGTGNGGGSGGLGGTGSSPSPQPTVTGGSSSTVTDPIDSLTIPVPSGWTGTSGSTSGEGSWPSLSTGSYTCPSALAQQNGSSSSATACTRGGVNFNTAQGSDVKSTVESEIAQVAKGNYGTLSSHSVVSEGAISVAGRTGYQITWSVVPNYTGPSGTVQLIALPDPELSGYLALIDIGLDKSSQAPSLSSVDSQIINNITDSSAAGA